MTRKPKVQRKRVKALTDPQPEFVSLVTAGANMTPFKALKADGVEDAPATEPAAAEPAAEPVVTDEVVAKADTHDIAKIVFQKAEFADTEAVTKWLADGGYAEYGTISETDDTFFVGEDKETATKIEYTGVIVYVAERAPAEVVVDDAPAAEAQPSDVTEVQPVAKADEPEVVADATVDEARAKYDEFMAMFSEGTTFEKVLADGYDGLPPAIHEVTSAMYVAVRNSALARNMDSIKAAASAYGDMVVKLCELFPAEAETEAAKAALSAEAPALDAGASETISDAPADAPVSTDTVVAKAEDAPAETPPADAPAEVVVASDTPVPNAEVLALTATVAKLAESVQQLTDGFRDLHNQVTVKADDLAGRVSAIESERQSRKGAAEDELQAGSASVAKQKSTGLADLSMRAALGIRRRGA